MSHVMMDISRRVVCFFLLVHGVSVAVAAPSYSITTLGLTGSEYIRNDGYRFSTTRRLNELGQAIGTSTPYSGNNDLGPRAWFYDGATTIEIGLNGAEHTLSTGGKYISAEELNNAGQVVGSSIRYNGGLKPLGESVWFYDGTDTINIGFTGSDYTKSNGAKSSEIEDLNDAGYVTGKSRRYTGNDDRGQVFWRHYAGITVDIGLADDEHTRSNGFRWSDFSRSVNLNQKGQVIGYSERYNSSNLDVGRTSWIYDGTGNIQIGLVGPEHTGSDGSRSSDPDALNEAGQVVGSSIRYEGKSMRFGGSAWLYDGAATVDIGLTGSEHTRSDGYKSSGVAGQLNEAGQTIGSSERFNGGSVSLGVSAWLYDGASTIDIGLSGPEHTRNDDYKLSSARRLNEAGQVMGYSERYMGSNSSLGRSAWLFDGASTVDIGLVGSDHTRSDGYRFSVPQLFNEAGLVAGYSERYVSDASQFGQDAWLFDPVLDQTFALNFSIRSDGYAYSSVQYLVEDGTVLGTYTLFDAQDNDLGPRAFAFSVSGGFQDLGAMVAGGLAVNGWDWLADVVRGNGKGHILGNGKPSAQSGGQLVYLLTPVVPEPATVVLAVVAVAALLVRCRPRSSS